MGPAGRPGVSLCDLSPFFFDCSRQNTCGLSSGLVKAGISEQGRVTPPVGTFTVEARARKTQNVLNLHVKHKAFQVLRVLCLSLLSWPLDSVLLSSPIENLVSLTKREVKMRYRPATSHRLFPKRAAREQRGLRRLDGKVQGEGFPVETDSLLSKRFDISFMLISIQDMCSPMKERLCPCVIDFQSSFWGLTRRPNKVRLSFLMGFD